MTKRDYWGLTIVATATALLILYRYVYIEPRFWGAACASASAPAACVPRGWLLLMQRYYLWGGLALALGLWTFIGRGGFIAQISAIVLGVAGIENYNATWAAVGIALAAWCWLRRENWAL